MEAKTQEERDKIKELKRKVKEKQKALETGKIIRK